MQLEFVPRYNIAPTQTATVLRIDNDRIGPAPMTWGFRADWTKAPIINAKSETVAEKALFTSALRNRRCLIPADGFYEWKTEGTRRRPFRICPESGQSFCFAGLWQEADEGEAPGAFLILTTAADPMMSAIHTRMPILLDARHYDAWVDPEGPDVESLLRSGSGISLRMFEVCSRVNSVRNEGPECLAPPQQLELL